MSTMRKVYAIGGKNYYQMPLTAGQKIEVLKVFNAVLSENVDPATGTFKLELERLAQSLSGDHLAHFIGTLLIADGQLPGSLARVQSFTERGRDLLFQMEDEVEVAVFEDFFSLNKPLIERLLGSLGLNLDRLSSDLSEKLSTVSDELSSSSHTDGAKTPEP